MLSLTNLSTNPFIWLQYSAFIASTLTLPNGSCGWMWYWNIDPYLNGVKRLNPSAGPLLARLASPAVGRLPLFCFGCGVIKSGMDPGCILWSPAIRGRGVAVETRICLVPNQVPFKSRIAALASFSSRKRTKPYLKRIDIEDPYPLATPVIGSLANPTCLIDLYREYTNCEIISSYFYIRIYRLITVTSGSKSPINTRNSAGRHPPSFNPWPADQLSLKTLVVPGIRVPLTASNKEAADLWEEKSQNAYPVWRPVTLSLTILQSITSPYWNQTLVINSSVIHSSSSAIHWFVRRWIKPVLSLFLIACSF